ncbi:hypothetical protein GMO_22280 [Gluconobacter morbifer G707]|uniref:GYF domain-containing protein n=2 Tax=Gluconobacter TaxID=441 RepID=G6XLH9_9PROT|nr:hypothetical protein GMO_22280 [Gluconobacter morbifer G707]
MEWFYENNGQQIGPVSREEMLRLIMQQRIRPETLVWTASFGSSWRPAAGSGLVSPLTGLLRFSAGIPEHWAWVVLVGPWLMQRATLLILNWRHVADIQRLNTLSLVGLMSLVLFLTAFMLDRNAIRESGAKPPGFWWWLFLPGYFWKRRRIVRSGTTLFLVSVMMLTFNVAENIQQWPQIQKNIQILQHKQVSSHPASGADEQREEL